MLVIAWLELEFFTVLSPAAINPATERKAKEKIPSEMTTSTSVNALAFFEEKRGENRMPAAIFAMYVNTPKQVRFRFEWAGEFISNLLFRFTI